jgi:hypothetical protein
VEGGREGGFEQYEKKEKRKRKRKRKKKSLNVSQPQTWFRPMKSRVKFFGSNSKPNPIIHFCILI